MPSSRAELLDDLRRRIDRIERRPPAPSGPRLPPGPIFERAPSLGGGMTAPWGALFRAHVDRVGTVAPADAILASRSVAAVLCGVAPPLSVAGVRVLDIETTGLSGGTGTLPFLVGLGSVDEEGRFLVEQLLLDSPAVEPALLAALVERLEGASLLVTYNGRSFDLPLLRTRCLLRGVPGGPLSTLPHLDLRAPAGWLWRDRAGDCRLATLEEHVLGRRRAEDLAGARPLAAILDHNRDDVAGTAALLVAALRVLDDPLAWAEDAGELIGAARLRAATVGPGAALPLVARALDLSRAPGQRRRALTFLATLQRRLGAAAAARVTWERYRAEFPRENRGHVEVAKHLEHRGRDLEAALAAALAAPHGGADDVRHRVKRLRHRLRRRRTRA